MEVVGFLYAFVHVVVALRQKSGRNLSMYMRVFLFCFAFTVVVRKSLVKNMDHEEHSLVVMHMASTIAF